MYKIIKTNSKKINKNNIKSFYLHKRMKEIGEKQQAHNQLLDFLI